MKSNLKELMKKPEISAFLFLIILCVGISFGSGIFLTSANMINILRQISRIAILAVAMAFTIISGGIDLSIGRLVGMSAIIGAFLISESGLGLPPAVGLAGMVLAGSACGLVNGLLITRLGIPPFIATLGMSNVSYGIALMISRGMPIRVEKTWITFFGGGKLGNIPFSILIMLLIILLGFFISKYTVYGRNIYITGNSEKAAKLSGINVKTTRIIPYVMNGLLAAIVGLILLGQMSTADAGYGDGNELDAIAAAVIGGISMSGGEGNIGGIIVGAAIMGVLNNAFTLLRVPAYWQTFCLGIVIICSVALDCARKLKADR
ncbi:ABC transporter permease [Lachnospiraceae bacterium ASD3451]|uniref:ABC transporter permease n=1 Tax=Diplocloster agilis TaxID=2850323 RepID=UPI001DCA1402|nr:ABC transporter permease [Diplocloster agilis]MBU9746808.1 ABC transporter permease [Diplocloster agilis]